ncbi:MAG: pantoate--beta-alanine ligase [Deltaproteobacteria bacterium]|nr:pantoate--beta-alanine ligase [Deltaproteobacteria bacterium]
MGLPTDPLPAVVHAPEAFRAACDQARAQGRRVALVPTMGALHSGHVALMTEARRRVGPDGLVAVSVFVNPTQFGPNEDLARYPRELDADVARCAAAGVDVVFAPAADAMYPPGDQTRVRVAELAGPMCGLTRPTHFEGVATVVTRLFALAGPCVAVFGRKDYQQLRVISRLARDLFLPVEVVGLPTVREPDGLALSSRNRYLSPADRARATTIPASLRAARALYARGERSVIALLDVVSQGLAGSVDSVDYIELRDADELTLPTTPLPHDARAVLAVAVKIGATRLIDNTVLGELDGTLD